MIRLHSHFAKKSACVNGSHFAALSPLVGSSSPDHDGGFLSNPDADMALRPDDFATHAKVGVIIRGLFVKTGASQMAAALVPWICDALPSPNSRKAYHDDLKSFLRQMEEIGVSSLQVTGDHLRLYKEAMLRAGKKGATIARALSVIRGTYEQFGKKGYIDWQRVGDIQSVTSPRVEKNTTPALSELEASRLLHAPDTSTLVGLRDHALLHTYFLTACRCSALINARVGDIEKTDTRYYLVVKEKGGKQQRKALLDADAAVLRWMDAAGITKNIEGSLFRAIGKDRKTVLSRGITRDTVRKMIKRQCRKVGIDPNRIGRRGIGVHSLRKTAITNALEHGAKMEQVQALAGHSDIRTTQLYYQPKDRDAEDAAKHIQIR